MVYKLLSTYTDIPPILKPFYFKQKANNYVYFQT
jgi:hypothetical protein